MNRLQTVYTGFAITLLLLCLFFGSIAVIAFFAPNSISQVIPFQQARPIHVSAALFWIITAATSGIIQYCSKHPVMPWKRRLLSAFQLTWMVSVCSVIIAYALKMYGGREYWEFPPVLNIFLLAAWLFLIAGLFRDIFRLKSSSPVYVWMWATGILFFLFTFLEQNLWHIAWFRQSFLKEMTVQWKSNGSMVGAWNQMVYGTAIYLMARISNDEQLAKSWKAYASFFLGLFNLIFNWGHHIYNVPSASWIRDVAYAVSMTEWILIISIIYGFKKKLEERRKFRHIIAYRFLIAAEFWIFVNLLLALLMSIPAINRYTHGTHITVAHAMGTTIGINTMILLASLAFMMQINRAGYNSKTSLFNICYWTTQVSLLLFWVALVVAGIIKGINTGTDAQVQFTQVTKSIEPVLRVFMYAGFSLSIALFAIGVIFLKHLKQAANVPLPS